MNINDILEKVTLQLPGGGKLPLNKYSKYITNGEATVEGLAEGSLFDFDPTYKPVKYLANVPKDVDAAIAEWRFEKTIKPLNEWKIFTEDELKEYVNNINEIVGNKHFVFSIGDDGPNPSILPLYSEEVPENTTIQIGMLVYWEQIGFGISPLYTNNPVEITELLANGEMGNYTDEELDFLNANVINEGLHIYFDSKVVNGERPDEITDEEAIESISKHFVKIYDNSLNGNNINLYFYDIDNNENQVYNCNIGNGNGYYDENTSQYYCWAPIGTFYVTSDNGDTRINDGNDEYSLNTNVSDTDEITFDKNHSYRVYLTQL